MQKLILDHIYRAFGIDLMEENWQVKGQYSMEVDKVKRETSTKPRQAVEGTRQQDGTATKNWHTYYNLFITVYNIFFQDTVWTWPIMPVAKSSPSQTHSHCKQENYKREDPLGGAGLYLLSISCNNYISTHTHANK